MTTDDPHGPHGAGDADGPQSSGDGANPLDEARELREVAARLRAVLDDEAGTITPSNRLAAVLAAAHEAPTAAARRRRRWAPAAAAAAALVVVAGGVALASRPGAPPVSADGTVTATPAAPLTLPSTPARPSSPATSIPTRTAAPPVVPTMPSRSTSTTTRAVPPPPPPATTTSAPSTTSATSAPPSPTTPATSATDAPPSTSPDLPVYLAGPVVDGSSRLVLFRTWAPTDLPRGDLPRRVQAALELALGAPAKGTPWVSLSPDATVEGATVTDAGITVTLAAPLDGGSDATTALALQQLVFTAQAAAGKPSPVTVELADGSAEVAPGVAAGSTLQRPDAAASAKLLSAVWVDQPPAGATATAGEPLTVRGAASTYEATVVWQVLRGTTVVEQGSATADAAAPRRGSFSFTTEAPLPAGDYTVRVYAESADDGSTVAEQRVPVTVR